MLPTHPLPLAAASSSTQETSLPAPPAVAALTNLFPLGRLAAVLGQDPASRRQPIYLRLGTVRLHAMLRLLLGVPCSCCWQRPGLRQGLCFGPVWPCTPAGAHNTQTQSGSEHTQPVLCLQATQVNDNGSICLYKKSCSLPHCMHCTPWNTSQLTAKPIATAAVCTCRLLCQVRFPPPSTTLLTCCRCCLQVMQAPAQLMLHQHWPALGPAQLAQRCPHPS